jgi:hypothetical protein
MFIPLCTPILIRFPYPPNPSIGPSVPTAPKERPWQVGARPGRPRFRPRPKRCAPAGFGWPAEVTLGGQLTPFSACSIHTICIINMSICVYKYIYISSNVNGINVNTQMLFFRWECRNALLNLNLCGFPTPVSSGLRARYFGESCNLDAIREIWSESNRCLLRCWSLLALAESSSSWTLLPHSFWVKFAAFAPVSVWNFRRKYVQAHIDLLDIAL